jgi:3-isopropylmalate/(R)-2-methylmalate dehydratase small subunit
LPVTVSEGFLKKIFAAIEANPATQLEVNLSEQSIKIAGSADPGETFDINSYKKTCLLNGYDDIDYLLSMRKEIEQFEEEKL